MNEQKPTWLFLCGVGRSGTTVLRTSLGCHPQIYYNGFENNIVQDVIEVALRNCTMESRKKAMVVSQDQYDEMFRELLNSLVWPNKELGQRPVHLAAINPTPEQLDYLIQLFPGCKFIGLVRNGIEVVSSRTEYQSFATNTFTAHCEIWNRAASVYEWGQKHSDCFLEVRQEWFYAPQRLHQWMELFCEWLSIEFSEEPKDKILGTLRHPTSADIQIGRREFQSTAIEDKEKYFLSKRDRWRTWTPEQQVEFANLCGENMTMLGYDIPWVSSTTNSRLR